MDKVQKRGFIKYNTPSSEPFRIELSITPMQWWKLPDCNYFKFLTTLPALTVPKKKQTIYVTYLKYFIFSLIINVTYNVMFQNDLGNSFSLSVIIISFI
jgi:hypothetical protein